MLHLPASSVREVFDTFDNDPSGGIGVSELVGALQRLGINVSESQAHAILGRYSTSDSSSTLNFYEFDRLVSDLSKFQENAVRSADAEREAATPETMSRDLHATNAKALISARKSEFRGPCKDCCSVFAGCCCVSANGKKIYCCLPTGYIYILPLCLHVCVCPQQGGDPCADFYEEDSCDWCGLATCASFPPCFCFQVGYGQPWYSAQLYATAST